MAFFLCFFNVLLSCYGFFLLVSFTLFPPFFSYCLSFLFVSLCLFLCNCISFGHFPLSNCLWFSRFSFFLPFFLLCCLSVGVCFVIIWALRSSLYRMKLSGTERRQWRCLPWPALPVLSLCVCVCVCVFRPEPLGPEARVPHGTIQSHTHTA